MPAIVGYVLAMNQRPLPGVRISRNGKVVARSGDDGSFSVELKKAERRVVLTFAAEGFVSNTRVFDAVARGNNVVVIWPVAYRVQFDPAKTFEVGLGSSRFGIPAGALVDAQGKKLSAPVELLFTLLDVTSPIQRAAAPGDFSARLRDGGIQKLASFGIFELAVRDLKGNPVGLRRGASVEVAIAVPPAQARGAAKKVGFYDFDVADGRWIEEGSFTFTPSTRTYNGSITRLAGLTRGGAHNLDVPIEVVCVTLRVVDTWNATPMPYFQVDAASTQANGAQYTSTGTSDANGMVCLLVQKNATITAAAFGPTSCTIPGTEPTFTTPNFSSSADDCGDADKCPLLGDVPVDLIVGKRSY